MVNHLRAPERFWLTLVARTALLLQQNSVMIITPEGEQKHHQPVELTYRGVHYTR